jgi:hypothetical protein
VSFKIGDLVKVIDISDCNDYYILDKVYTITSTSSGFEVYAQYYLDDINDMFAWEDEIKAVYIDNELNRLLYPEYIAVNGYLEKKDGT